MARVNKDCIGDWTQRVDAFLGEHYPHLDRAQILNGKDAWNIAHIVNLPWEAYRMGFYDHHIRTALTKIFPNAKFLDSYR